MTPSEFLRPQPMVITPQVKLAAMHCQASAPIGPIRDSLSPRTSDDNEIDVWQFPQQPSCKEVLKKFHGFLSFLAFRHDVRDAVFARERSQSLGNVFAF